MSSYYPISVRSFSVTLDRSLVPNEIEYKDNINLCLNLKKFYTEIKNFMHKEKNLYRNKEISKMFTQEINHQSFS